MIGQIKLLAKIASCSLDNFPRSLLLLGDKGCGKHQLVDIIKSKLNLPVVDMTDIISAELIDEIYMKPIPSIYILDLTKLVAKQQNIMLKFIEEPLKNSYIILLAENKNTILPTILNRCIVYEFEMYSKAELEPFIQDTNNKELLLKVCNTPGKLLNAAACDLTGLYNLCSKIVDKVHLASLPNTLSISDRLNYKDEYDKFDVILFFEILILLTFDRYVNTNDISYLKLWEITREYKERLSDNRLNKKYIVDNYLLCIWEVIGSVRNKI